MIILEWAPIKKTDCIPPFGEALRRHLVDYKGTVKYASCSAWSLLYKVLEEKRMKYGTVLFEENGKPYFEDCLTYFSLSHSRDICAVGISDKPIGIDVELQKKSYNANLVERSLSEAEKQCFDGDFTRIWCRKEAIAKMLGVGITGYPNNIDTTSYQFKEQQIEFLGQLYWLVTVNKSRPN